MLESYHDIGISTSLASNMNNKRKIVDYSAIGLYVIPAVPIDN